MNSSARDRHALDAIESELTGSDPKLASMLNAFTRLTAGEGMPGRERTSRPVRAGRLRAILRMPPRGGGRARLRREFPLLLWLAISIVMISVAVVLSNANPDTCAHPSAPACPRHSQVNSAVTGGR